MYLVAPTSYGPTPLSANILSFLCPKMCVTCASPTSMQCISHTGNCTRRRFAHNCTCSSTILLLFLEFYEWIFGARQCSACLPGNAPLFFHTTRNGWTTPNRLARFTFSFWLVFGSPFVFWGCRCDLAGVFRCCLDLVSIGLHFCWSVFAVGTNCAYRSLRALDKSRSCARFFFYIRILIL